MEVELDMSTHSSSRKQIAAKVEQMQSVEEAQSEELTAEQIAEHLRRRRGI